MKKKINPKDVKQMIDSLLYRIGEVRSQLTEIEEVISSYRELYEEE